MCFWSFYLLRLTFFSISSISSLFSYHILRWTFNLIVNLAHFAFFRFPKLGWFSSPQNSLSPWRLPRSNIASTSHRIQAISAFWHIFFNFWNSYRCVSVFLYCWISNAPWKVKSESESHSVVSDSLWSSPWSSPGQDTGVGSLSLLQGIFPIQGSNPGLPHCGQILYQLSHRGSPRILEWVSYPLSGGSSQPRNRTRVSCIAGRFFTNWAIREALENSVCSR